MDGIIVAGTGSNNRLIRDLSTEMPVVQVIRGHDKTISSVVADYEEIGYKATSCLIEKGCTKIGIINGQPKLRPYAERYIGYEKALTEHGLTPITAERDSQRRGLRYGYDCTVKLLDENVHLDAILASTDAQGIGALRALKENHVEVPEQMKVISMTGHGIGDMLMTSLTSMELPGMEMGQQALDMLVRAIEKEDGDTPNLQHLKFSAVLVERETTM